jgi:hypothetical protein
MRATLASAVLALVLASGCGGFEDAPFKEGVISGRFNASVDTVHAWVAIFGHPETMTLVAGDGSFRLGGVPVGSAELIGVVSSRATMRTTVAVQGGSVTDLGSMIPQRASDIEVRVSARGGQLLSGGRVDIVGTPLTNLPIDDDGDLDVGAVPLGCYAVGANVPGMGTRQEQHGCVSEGQHLTVDYALPDPNGSEGFEGCAVTGCHEGLNCLANGECE